MTNMPGIVPNGPPFVWPSVTASRPTSTASDSTTSARDSSPNAAGDRGSTSTTYHELNGGILLEITGEGGRSIDQLRAMYDRYRIPDPGRDPDIRCEMTDDEPRPEVVLGWPESYYGRDGDQFVIRQRGEFLTVDAAWNHVSTSPGWEPYHTVYVIEFEVRRHMARAGWALLHGCGFQFDGQTVLCPSLRGAGKTNALLSVLQAGGAYLSDDRVWVNGHGAVRGYPVPINPHTEQYQSFPEMTEPDTSLGARAVDFLEEHLDRSRSILDKGFLFLAAELLGEESRSFRDINDLLPEATYVPEADADRVALLRAAPQQSQVTVDEISDAALSRALEKIHHYEWNGQLTEYFLAFDALFSEGEKSAQLDQVRSAEQAIFDQLPESLSTALVKVPREPNWSETGISEQIRTTFGTHTAPEAEPSSR